MELEIVLARGLDRELRTRDQLVRLLTRYELEKWTFTGKIIIEEGAVPHSHLVLTLNTEYLGDDELFLGTYIHEQTHWYLSSKPRRLARVTRLLRRVYRSVATFDQGGARNDESTYLHIIVCCLEYKVLIKLLGDEVAKHTIRRRPVYSWIYHIVQKDFRRLDAVLEENDIRL